jgi:hypothetical protein
MAQWDVVDTEPRSIEDWKKSLRLACSWATEVSQVRTVEHGLNEPRFPVHRYADWRGAFRGEYNAGRQRWDTFCPYWHGGQGIKGLAMAAEALGDAALLEAARFGAQFILRGFVADPKDEDFGFLLAYEMDDVNTSAALETLDGLFELARVTGEQAYNDAAIANLRWHQRVTYLPDQGLFVDDYDPQTRRPRIPTWLKRSGNTEPGRPLLDDAVYITGWRLTGDESLKDVAVRVADRLLRDEDPPGNWKAYPPANKVTGVIHPRHAYWWGRPMWMVYEATGDTRYLEAAQRSAVWYLKAMRHDGGLFRNTGPDFSTPSFGHATSGVCGAAILWMELAHRFDQTQWLEPARKALKFCHGMQFENPADPNLRGAILEKVLPPARCDRPPWHLRDVGTFFYIQAVAYALRHCPQALVQD